MHDRKKTKNNNLERIYSGWVTKVIDFVDFFSHLYFFFFFLYDVYVTYILKMSSKKIG